MKCCLRERRMERHLTQKELAELSGIPQPRLSRYENNRETPSLEIALKIARALNCPVEDIWLPE